ncbi:orotate phosphoribosyltransferase [bacterium]|nr:orotate phosphoribosyltransferase [bacterium]
MEKFRKFALKRAIENNALIFKKTKLSSGRITNYYFNIKRISLHPQYINLIADQVLNILIEENCHCIGGLALGAIPLVSAIVTKSWDLDYSIYGFYIRPNPKNHGLQNQIEGYLIKKSKIYLIDDVITTGNSILNAIDILERYGYKVDKVIVIIDRSKGIAKQKLINKNIKLMSLYLAEEFVVLTNKN